MGLNFDFLIYSSAVFGLIMFCIIVWNLTYDLRYDFKVKYILSPKFKKGDYVLVPDRNNKPVLAQVKSVSTDWGEKAIEYEVRPTHFGNDHVDFEYFEQLNFDESCVYEIWKYCNIEIWDRMLKNNESKTKT